MTHRSLRWLCTLLLSTTAACVDGPWPDTVTDAATYLEDEGETCGGTSGSDTDTTTGGSCEAADGPEKR